MVAWWKQFLACRLKTCWSVKKKRCSFYDHVSVCGHMHACADKQALLPVHPRAIGQLNTELKSHYPCWETRGEAGVSQESCGWDGWRETREWEKEGWSSLDQNSVCWGVRAVSGKDGQMIQRDKMTGVIDVGTALVWGVNLSWRPHLWETWDHLHHHHPH